MKAAKVRGDGKVLSQNEEECSEFVYHRRCYQSYTNKKSLEKFQSKSCDEKQIQSRTRRETGKQGNNLY